MKFKICHVFAYCCPFPCVPDTRMCKQMLVNYTDNTGCSKSLCGPYSVYSNTSQPTDDLKMAITEYIRNVDRAMLNTVFENTVRPVNKCLETGRGTLNITCNFLYCNHQVHRDFWSSCTSQFRFKKQRAINDKIFIYGSESCNTKFLRNIFEPTKLMIAFIFEY
jgi:hypothetical protein